MYPETVFASTSAFKFIYAIALVACVILANEFAVFTALRWSFNPRALRYR